MNFYLSTYDGNKYRTEDCVDGQWISCELLNYLIKKQIICIDEVPTLYRIDPFGTETIYDVVHLKHDIELICSRLKKLDLSFNQSFYMQYLDLSGIIQLCNYAIQFNYNILSVGD